MIFLCNTQGEITAAIPSAINQGSIRANKIVLIAPFPDTTVVTATFTLPNGVKLYPRYVSPSEAANVPYLMAYVPSFEGKLFIDGVSTNVWELSLDKAITQVAGNVQVQFFFTAAGDVLTSSLASLPVSRGNAYLSPSVSESDFEIITQYLNAAEIAAGAAEEARRAAEAAADRADKVDAVAPWDVVALQDTVLAILNSMAYQNYKSFLFKNIDFTTLNLNRYIVDGVPLIIFSDSIEKVEFRGCNFGDLAICFKYSGSQCSISGAKGDELIIEGFADVIDCRADIIKDSEYVAACDANVLNDCECVTDSTIWGEAINCKFVDPFTVNGFVPADDEGKVATLNPSGEYAPTPLPQTISVEMNSNTYVLTIKLKDLKGTVISQQSVDLPLESMIVNAELDANGDLVLTLQNGVTLTIPLAQIFGSLSDEIAQKLDANQLTWDGNILYRDNGTIRSEWTETGFHVEDAGGSYTDVSDVGVTVETVGVSKAVVGSDKLTVSDLENGKTATVKYPDLPNGTVTTMATLLDISCATPEQFGAKGDGVTDDTQAIQAALDAADCVKFDPAKTYKVSGTINVGSNKHLDGRGATIYGGSIEGTNRIIFVISSSSNVIFDNLTVKGDNDHTAYDTNAFGTSMRTSNLFGISGSEVTNLVVNNCIFDGVLFAVKINDNTADIGVANSHHITIDGCVTRNGVGMPFYFGSSTDIHVTRCDIDAATNTTTTKAHHFYISASCDNIFVTNNHFSGGTGYVFTIGTSTSGAIPPRDIIIHNNLFECSAPLLGINYSSNVTITNNTIFCNSDTPAFYGAINAFITMSGNNINLISSEGVNSVLMSATNTVLRSTGDVITCGKLHQNTDGIDYEFSNCVLTLNATSGSPICDLSATTVGNVRLVACTVYLSMTGNGTVVSVRNPQQVVCLDRCTFYNSTTKNFAIAPGDAYKQFYLLNCVFIGFTALKYGTSEVGTYHNTVALPIATP